MIAFLKTGREYLAKIGLDVVKVLLLEGIFVTFKNPSFDRFLVFSLLFFQIQESMEISKRIPSPFSILLLSWQHFLIVFSYFYILHKTVVNRLICIFVIESEPSSVEFAFFYLLFSQIESLYSQKEHGAYLLYASQINVDFLIVVDFEHWISNVFSEVKSELIRLFFFRIYP
jgi:hypothetical protein